MVKSPNPRQYWKRVMLGSAVGSCGAFFALLFAVEKACPNNDCTAVESTSLDLAIVGLAFLIFVFLISTVIGIFRYLWAVLRNKNTENLIPIQEPLEAERDNVQSIVELEPVTEQEETNSLAKNNIIKTQLMSAITYIKKRDYGQVKEVLSKIDHPKVRELLQKFNDNAIRNPRFWVILAIGIVEILDLLGDSEDNKASFLVILNMVEEFEDNRDRRKFAKIQRRIDTFYKTAQSANEIKSFLKDLL